MTFILPSWLLPSRLNRLTPRDRGEGITWLVEKLRDYTVTSSGLAWLVIGNETRGREDTKLIH